MNCESEMLRKTEPDILFNIPMNPLPAEQVQLKDAETETRRASIYNHIYMYALEGCR